MAFFACAKAAQTGTDKATRASIAKGLVSPTYTVGGKEYLRGVVQLDIVTGRDTGYVTASTAVSRAKAAAAASRAANETVFTQMRKTARAAVNPPAQVAVPQPTLLHSTGAGQVGNTGTPALSKKNILIGAMGIGVVLFLVMR